MGCGRVSLLFKYDGHYGLLVYDAPDVAAEVGVWLRTYLFIYNGPFDPLRPATVVVVLLLLRDRYRQDLAVYREERLQAVIYIYIYI